MRAVDDESKVFKIGYEERTTPETIIEGHKVRPHIVFFQEAVPMFETAADIASLAGTSLVVYPAAGLLNYVRRGVPVYYIDPRPSRVPDGVTVIRKPATTGMAELEELLLKQFGHHEKD